MKLKLLAISFLLLLPSFAGAATIGKVQSNSIGLVGYWPLDGSTVNWATGIVRDLSGQGNNGNQILMSTTTSPVAGKIGGALNFNGVSGYINLNKNQSALMSASTSTISVWMKPTGTSVGTVNGSTLPAVIGNSDGDVWISNGNYGSGDNIWVGLYDTGGRDIGLPYSLNQWVHVVMVHANGILSVYQNGVLANSVAASAQDGGNINFPLVIGKNNWKNLTFKGAIDDVRIYNRALSATEVAALYNIGAATAAHSNTGTNAPLSNGLVGYWTLDGSKTNWTTGQTLDSSGQGNTGQLINMSTTTSPVAGKIGGALKFDGTSQYVNFGSFILNLQNSQDFTVSAWIMSNNISAGAEAIVAQRNSGNGFWFGINSSKLETYCSGFLVSNATLVSGVWYHVVATHQANGNINFYLNGSADGSSASGTCAESSTLSIGRQNDSPGISYFPGSIDDVRVYNRALSATEVAALYNLGAANVAHSNTGASAPLSNGLVGYWTLDGSKTNWATGQTQDSSGQGNTGQLISMSTTTSPVAGKIGGALKFNGTTNYATVADSSALNLTHTGSIFLWIKPSSTANSVVAAKGDVYSDTNAYGLYFYSASLWAEIDSSSAHNFAGTSVTGVPVGVWSHVGLVWDGSNVYLYVNGVQKSSIAQTVDASPSGFPLNIAADGLSTAGEKFSGADDDVRVYNRALSPTEVQALYNSGR